MNSRPESGSSRSESVVARLFIGFFALLLIYFEVAGILQNQRVLEMYVPPDATAIIAAAHRLMIAHVIRSVVIASLFTGWRWSLWLTAATYLVVYLPNPWVAAHLVNPDFWPVLLLPFLLIAYAGDRQLLIPWRDNAVGVRGDAAGSAEESKDA